jgi:hypothetical protein
MGQNKNGGKSFIAKRYVLNDIACSKKNAARRFQLRRTAS